MKRYTCDLCGRKVLDYSFFEGIHICLDVIGMFLFLSKLFMWLVYKPFTLKSTIRNFPCTCGHVAFWHLTPFKDNYLPLDAVNWFYLLFKYKFIKDEKKPLATCLLCNFNLKKDYRRGRYELCFEFEPINNLTYLEDLYKKGK